MFFLITIILLNLMPGPAMFYVAQQTMHNGLRAGVFSILGIEFGTLLHILAARMGLTLALTQFDHLFTIIQYLSAAFLIYLGVSQLLKTKQMRFLLARDSTLVSNPSSLFIQGTIINLLNPKVIIFFVGLLPQFIDSTSNHLNLQILLLGLVFGFFGGLVNIAILLIVTMIMKKANKHSHTMTITQWITRIISSIFIMLGISMIMLRALNS